MADTDTLDPPETTTTSASPASLPRRRGRVVAGAITAALIGFAAVARVVGVEIPLMVLGGGTAAGGAAYGYGKVRKWIPARNRRMRFSASRTRTFGGGRKFGTGKLGGTGRKPGLPKLGGKGGSGRPKGLSPGRMAGLRRSGSPGRKGAGKGLGKTGTGRKLGSALKGKTPGLGTRSKGGRAAKTAATRLGKGTGNPRTGTGGRPGAGLRKHLPTLRKRTGQGNPGWPGAGRKTLGQRLRLPGANRRAGRRAAAPGTGTTPAKRQGMFRRAAAAVRRKRQANTTKPKGRTGRILDGIAAAIALPFAGLVALRRRSKRQAPRKPAGQRYKVIGPRKRGVRGWWARVRGWPARRRLQRAIRKGNAGTAILTAVPPKPRFRRLRKLAKWRPRKRHKQPAPGVPAPMPADTVRHPGIECSNPACLDPAHHRPPQPQKAPTERIPTSREDGTHREVSAMTAAIDATNEAVDQHIGGFEPQNATDLDQFLQDFPQLFEHFGSAVLHLAGNLGDQFPVDPALPEKLREIGASVSGLADQAAEAHGVHRNVHEAEMNRIENPRPNEQMWDTTNQ